MSAYFVTGTDTEIGKTLIASALLHALTQQGVRAIGMKPVAAGAELVNGVWHNDDADRLRAAGNVKQPVALTTPYLLHEATAPHIAAAHENVTLEVAHLLECYAQLRAAADAVVVEGVGGFCVPLNEHADMADFAQQLALPVVLVVGLRLGCINHALLTAQAIAACGLTLAGWVANTVDAELPNSAQNIATLQARLPAPLLGCVPRLLAPSAAAAAANLNFKNLPGWPDKAV